MLNKAKPKRLKCKGYDLRSRILNLDTKYSGVGKALYKGIPVLSIFALLGIMVSSVSCNALTMPRSESIFYNLANIVNPVSLLSSVGNIASGGDSKAYAADEVIGDSTASITISGSGKAEAISAGRGSTVYRAHNIAIAGSNVRSYILSIYGDSNLKYANGNDILTSANGATGKVMNDNASYNNTWGYSYEELVSSTSSGTDNANLTYTAPLANNVATTLINNRTVPTSNNGVLASYGKLVFAAKFDEDKPSGNYRANVNLALTITPRVLTTYSVTYNGNSNTSGTAPAKQSIDLYDTTSYSFTAPTQGTLARSGYNFLGWGESPTATSAEYAAGSTISLTQASPTKTLYAVWEKVLTIKTITKMQEMTNDICKASAVGDSNTLTDTRDGLVYEVKKLNDSQCWMTQNLRIVDKTISPADSDMVSGSFTIPAQQPSSFAGSDNTLIAASYYDELSGAYYTWCAVTAGTCSSAMSTGVNASSSVCPKGWHLPVGGAGTTGVNTGVISDTKNDFMVMTGRTNISQFTDATYVAGYQLLLGGVTWPFTGIMSIGGGPHYKDSYGHYWSRTAYGSDRAYYMYIGRTHDASEYSLYALNATTSGTVNVADSLYRWGGRVVRCVAYAN